jgi:hypothetical protein
LGHEDACRIIVRVLHVDVGSHHQHCRVGLHGVVEVTAFIIAPPSLYNGLAGLHTRQALRMKVVSRWGCPGTLTREQLNPSWYAFTTLIIRHTQVSAGTT